MLLKNSKITIVHKVTAAALLSCPVRVPADQTVELNVTSVSTRNCRGIRSISQDMKFTDTVCEFQVKLCIIPFRGDLYQIKAGLPLLTRGSQSKPNREPKSDSVLHSIRGNIMNRKCNKLGSVNILMELFKKHSIDARYHLCLIIVVELIVATFLGCLEVCLRTLARSL